MPKEASVDKFEDWKAPWEKDGSEFDAEKAKKLLYNLYGDKESLEAKVKTVTGERDTLKAKVDELRNHLSRQIRSSEDLVAMQQDHIQLAMNVSPSPSSSSSSS